MKEVAMMPGFQQAIAAGCRNLDAQQPHGHIPDTFQENALGGALAYINGRHPSRAVLIRVDQQIPHLILVHLHKIHL